MSFFITGGTVQAEDGMYVERPADDELLALCERREFAYVLTPRQMGKSSLMEATAARLVERGVMCVVIDLQKIGTPEKKEVWYLGVLQDMADQLELETEVYDWWQRYPHLGETQRLTRFFEEVLLAEVDGQIVVFVDEIDTTISLDYTDDFFIAIRYFYTARSQNAELRRLSFVLIGVAMPGDLIKDSHRTPFNIGERVDLSDFRLQDVAGLAAGFGLPVLQGQQVMEWVLDWTGGHPYLTQKLCQSLVESAAEQAGFEWSKGVVAQVMRRTFVKGGDRSDQNLQFVRNMLVTNQSPDVEGGLRTYREIWKGRAVEDDEQSLVKSHLKLSGIVQQDEKRDLTVRNEIYRRVFDGSWVRGNWPEKSLWARVKPALPLLAAFLAIATVTSGLAVAANRANQIAQTALAREEGLTAELQEALNREEREKEKAEKATEVAENNAEQARQNAEEAEKQTDLAEASAIEAEEQTNIARRQTNLAEQRREEAEAASQRAEIARAGEAKQRVRAEEQTLVAQEKEKDARLQTSIAEANASQAFFLAETPFLSRLAAVRSWQALEPEDLNESSNTMPARLSLINSAYRNMEAEVSSNLLSENIETDVSSNLLSQQSPVKVLENRTAGYVMSVAFSPDSRMFATADMNGTIALWDRQGDYIKPLDHEGIVWDVSFSSDSQLILSTSSSGTIKLWNRQGSLLQTIENPYSFSFDDFKGLFGAPTPDRVMFIHDDSKVVFSSRASYFGGEGTVVKLWDRQGNELSDEESDELHSLVEQSYKDSQQSYSSDVTLTAFGYYGGEITLYGGVEGFDQSISISPTTVENANLEPRDLSLLTYPFSVSPDGSTLITANDGLVKLWNLTPEYLLKWHCNWLQTHLKTDQDPKKIEDVEALC